MMMPFRSHSFAASAAALAIALFSLPTAVTAEEEALSPSPIDLYPAQKPHALNAYRFAQEPVIFDDEPVIDTGDSAAGNDFNVFEYLDLQLLAGGSTGGFSSRSFSHIRIGGRYTWDELVGISAITVYGNVLSTDISSTLRVELEDLPRHDREECARTGRMRSPAGDLCADLLARPVERDFVFSVEDTSLDELYVNVDFSDQLSIIAGKNRLTWGQFSFLSPVHVLLPINTESQIGFSKVDTRLPQLLLLANYYPVERLQLQAVYIPESDIDPALDSYFQLRYRGEVREDSNYVFAPGYDASADADAIFSQHDQQAFRALYSPNWGTVGLTLWEGPVHFEISEHATLPDCITAAEYRCRTPQEGAALVAPDLNEGSGFGLEIAYNMGRWTLIAEHVQIDTQSAVRVRDALITIGDGLEHYPMGCARRGSNCQLSQEFLQTLVQYNGGRANIDTTVRLTSIGADGSGEKWNYNLQLLLFEESPRGSTDDLIERIRPYDHVAELRLDERFSSEAFPSFHTYRRGAVRGRPATLGFGLGFFLTYLGIFGYYNVELTDNLTVQGGLDFIRRNSEDNAAEDNDSDYRLLEDDSPALSFAAQLRF